MKPSLTLFEEIGSDLAWRLSFELETFVGWEVMAEFDRPTWFFAPRFEAGPSACPWILNNCLYFDSIKLYTATLKI